MHLHHRFLAVASVLGLLAAAAPQAVAGGDAVKIGILGDQSGQSADIGGNGSVLAARMAAEDVGGSVAGKRIEFVVADFNWNPDTAAAIARQWFDQDGVDAIADLPVTPAALAVQEIARVKQRVVLVTGASSNDLTGRTCNPYTVHWADDNAAIANSTASAIIEDGGRQWFFLTADFGFGHAMQQAATDVIRARGGTVIGAAVHPINPGDFSPFLLSAQNSHAQIIALASVGTDTVNAISQAHEFGISETGQRLAGLVVFETDIHAIGLDKAQGLYVASGFYWDQNDQSRAWAGKFFARFHRMPTRDQAATYAVVSQYLRAIDAAGTTDAATVVRQMKRMPASYFGRPASIRGDGRVLYDLTLYQVKAPDESHGEWDLYRPIRTVAAADAFLPMQADRCNFK
ncbi:MAG: ABC transporter substrate-binding protein [Acidisphaera sp.]|nr:ABC transporter substrate-binding protein [Acidisphaera sp.]MBV9813840.1 ABC transporter substrate-binding protein [Acetobacteraceae bacterium]